MAIGLLHLDYQFFKIKMRKCHKQIIQSHLPQVI